MKLHISLNDLEVIWNYNRRTYSYLIEILDEAAFLRRRGEKKEWDLIDLSQAVSHCGIHGVTSKAEHVCAYLWIHLSSEEAVLLLGK